MEVNIRWYEDVLITSAGDVFKTLTGASHGVRNRTVWGCLRDITLGRPHDVIFQRPKDVGRALYLVLHREPNGDVHRTSFGDVIGTSLGRHFANWDISIKKAKNYQ